MALTLDSVSKVLMADEPDYVELANRFGPAALPILEQLVRSDDELLAAKAASLAAAIGGAGATPVLEAAARRAEIGPRAVAAHGALRLPSDSAERILLALVEDDEPAVAKHALRTAAGLPTAAMRAKVQTLVSTAAHPTIADEAREALQRMVIPKPKP